MRQHVNPLSKNFKELKQIPPLNQIFENPNLPLHLDIGCASGDFLLELAIKNKNWNYLGIEIREKLVTNANRRIEGQEIKNLYFSFGNANNIFLDNEHKFLLDYTKSISFNFPDPWFKKKHFKRRVIQTELVNNLSNSLQNGTLIYIKTDVKDLFEYMENVILNNQNFRKIKKLDLIISKSFNPTRIKTAREKYALINEHNIYERIYQYI